MGNLHNSFQRTYKKCFAVIVCTLCISIIVLHMSNDVPHRISTSLQYVHHVVKGIPSHYKILDFQDSFKHDRPRCNRKSPALVGPLKVNLTMGTLDESRRPDVGGKWKPRDCVALHKVAIIIPYRDRKLHLTVLLNHLIPILMRQQLDFQIFVVEQHGNLTYNKGILLNAAYLEAMKEDDFQCFIFHDVDLISEDDRNMYTCSKNPKHMSVAVDKFNYRLPYTLLVGGVLALRGKHVETLNGYSNLYWGWGAEDDDLGMRIKTTGLNISRPPAYIGRYKMFKHDGRERSPLKWRNILLRTVQKRYKRDGVNSVEYNVTDMTYRPLYTHIEVDVGPPPETKPNISALLE